jgi:hypothetical protein
MTEIGVDDIGLMIMILLLGSLIFSCIWILRILFLDTPKEHNGYILPQQSASLEFLFQSFVRKNSDGNDNP